MTSKTFTAGTVIDSDWLNDVNNQTYETEVWVTRYLPEGYVTDGSVDYTTYFQEALDAAKTVYVPEGTWQHGLLYFNYQGQRLIGAGKYKTTLKVKAGANGAIWSKDFGVRADTAESVFILGFEVHDVAIDLTNTSNSSTVKGIAFEDTWDAVVNNVRIIDPDDSVNSARWGIYFGRCLYTSTIQNFTAAKVCLRGAGVNKTVSGGDNLGTTIELTNGSMETIDVSYYEGVSAFKCTWQGPSSKWVLGAATGPITNMAGDIEGYRYYVECNVAGGAAQFTSIGNWFGGFTGEWFGTNGAPDASNFTDIYRPCGSYKITGITRSGTTATVQVDTTTYGSTYKYGLPSVGHWVTVTGCGAPFDTTNGGIVLSKNTTTRQFTYAVANSGATTGTNGMFTLDDARGYRYTGMFYNALSHDPVASRFLFTDRLITNNQVGYKSFNTDRTTEIDLIQADSSNRMSLAGGKYVDSSGTLQVTTAGQGVAVTSPNGLVTKTLGIDNAGALRIF